MNLKKQLILNCPYMLFGLYATKLGYAWRLAEGADASQKLMHYLDALGTAMQSPWPSFHPADLLVGITAGAVSFFRLSFPSQREPATLLLLPPSCCGDCQHNGILQRP